MNSKRIDTVIFDLGNVLIGWDPRRLFRQLIDDEAQMEWFLREVCNSEWNEQQDAGRPWAEGTALLRARFPEHAELIDAYHTRWKETLLGPIEGSVAILVELKARGVRLLGAHQLVARNISSRATALPLPAMVRGDCGVRRGTSGET